MYDFRQINVIIYLVGILLVLPAVASSENEPAQDVKMTQYAQPLIPDNLLDDLVHRSANIFVGQIGAMLFPENITEIGITRWFKQEVKLQNSSTSFKMHTVGTETDMIFQKKIECERNPCYYVFFANVETVTYSSGYTFQAYRIVDPVHGAIPADQDTIEQLEKILKVKSQASTLAEPKVGDLAPNADVERVSSFIATQVGKDYFLQNYKLIKDQSLVTGVWEGKVESIVRYEYAPLTKISGLFTPITPIKIRIWSHKSLPEPLTAIVGAQDEPKISIDDVIKLLKAEGIDYKGYPSSIIPKTLGAKLCWQVKITEKTDGECWSGTTYHFDMNSGRLSSKQTFQYCH